MITQISDFGGNFRLPAGVPADLAQAAIFTSDSRLLRNFFDPSTIFYLVQNQTSSNIIENLRNGNYGFNYQWRELGVPFCYANTNWGIMGFNIENPQIPNELLIQIYALINDFTNNIKNLFQEIFVFNCERQNITGNNAIYRLIDNNRDNQIRWLDVGMILGNSSENILYSLLSIDYNNYLITVEEINSNFPDVLQLHSINIKANPRIFKN